MNARTFALLGALVLGVVLLSLLFLVDGREAGPGAGVSGDAVESSRASSERGETPLAVPAAGGEQGRAAVDLEPGAASGAASGEASGSATTRDIPREWPAAETRWIEARLVVPAGTPADERAHVLALAQGGDHADVYGAQGPAAALQGGAQARDIDGVLGAVPVDAAGNARLGLPPGFDEAWLVVSGAYLYTLEPQRIELDAVASPVELRPVLGARISGRLIAPPDKATGSEATESRVADVQVELDWSINARLQLGTAGAEDLDRETRSDAQGRFEFRAVPVGKPQTIATGDSTLARTFHEDIQPKPGEHVEVEIDLRIGGSVHGRVVDESGSPLVGAGVRALGREFFGNPTERLRGVDTGEDGRFQLAGLTPGKVFLRIEKQDHQVLLTPAFELADRELREYGDVVLSEGLALSGTVVFPDGRPAVGAVVSAQPDLSENIAGSPVDPRAYIGAGNEATADDAGAFRIRAVGSGPWVVAARLTVPPGPQGDTPGRWNALQGVVRAPADDLRLSLEPPVTVSGTVVDGQQRPVPVFSLRAERAGSQWYMPPSEKREETFESEDGRFELTDLRSGSWTFTADGSGYARSAEIPLELPGGTELTLVLLRPVRVAGRVVDPEGRPVAGAEVSEELEGTEVFEAMQGRGDWPVAKSDDQGFFALEALAPGAGSVLAKKDGFAPSEAVGFELGEGEEMLDVLLTLRRGGTISGEVYAKDGDLAPGCVVILQMPTLAERHFTNADGDGRFVKSGLKPGTWQVQAFPGIESLQSESGETLDQAKLLAALQMKVVELADESEEHVVLGAPPEDPVRVHGRVTLDDEPLTDAIISFVAAAGGGMESLKIKSLDDGGRYDLQLDEPGDYLVTIQSTGTPGRQNSLEFRRSVPSGEACKLDFELPLARVAGRVLGPRGEPLAQARVTLTVQGGLVFGTVFGGQYSESATDANGEYEITWVRPGSYTVAAGGSPLGGLLGKGAELGRKVRTIEVDEGESLRGVDFRLEEPGRVEGTVRDGSGKPVAGASIFVRDEQGNLVELFSLAQTNASGKFEYPGLAPGNYTVTARSQTLASPTGVPVRVRSGEKSEVTVPVGPGTMLLVTLEDKTGADLRSRVTVLDADDRDHNGMLGLTEIMERYSGGVDSTVQRVGPLPPGAYKVRAVAEDGRSTVRPVNLTGQAERKLTLRLK